MTRDEIVEVIREASSEDLGDVLLELAVNHWVTEGGHTPDEFRYLVNEVLSDVE